MYMIYYLLPDVERIGFASEANDISSIEKKISYPVLRPFWDVMDAKTVLCLSRNQNVFHDNIYNLRL
jgi:hypothetical protein